MSIVDGTRVTLVLEDDGASPERVDEDIRYLLEEVAQLDGVAVDRMVEDAAPSGTRGGGAELNALLVALGGSGAVLPMLVALLNDWLGRRRGGTIHLKIGSDEVRLDHVSSQAQREVLEQFLQRHRG